MHLIPLCDFELRYTSLELIDVGAGGQIYGTMEGTVSGERLRGRLRLTTTLLFRTAHPGHTWLNSVFAVLEGVLDSVAVDGVARGRAHLCEATL